MVYVKDTSTRNRLSLDGIWNFSLLQSDDYDASVPLDKSVPMPVPSAYNDIYEGREYRDHVGNVVYERSFDFSINTLDRDVVLRFSSVTHHATVFLNGKLLGTHKGGFLPFEFNVTSELKSSSNRLTVIVNNIVDLTTLPCGTVEEKTFPGMKTVRENIPNFDFFNYSGIMRPVWLYLVPKTRIDAIRIKADMDGCFSYDADVIGDADLKALILDEDKIIADIGDSRSAKLEGMTCWSVDNPKLYTLKLRLEKNGRIVDEYSEQFGFRTVEIKNCGFYLNGKKTYLKGFGKHEDIPVQGRGLNEAFNVKDLALMKWMGANSFRTSHYPYSEEMMYLCDRLGILVIDEVPAVGMHTCFTATLKKISVDTPTWETLKTADHHHDVLNDLIERDGNHPSVVIWSIANEPASEEKGAYEYFKPLFDFVHEKDWQGRPASFAAHLGANPDNCEVSPLCDVLMLNRYYGWYIEEGNVSATKALLADELDGFHSKYPDKPILLTEFGADAISGFHDTTPLMFSEEFQRDLIEAYCGVFDTRDYVIGEQVWNFADFATSESVKRVQGNKKGVFTRERKPKLAVWFLKERWEKNDWT